MCWLLNQTGRHSNPKEPSLAHGITRFLAYSGYLEHPRAKRAGGSSEHQRLADFAADPRRRRFAAPGKGAVSCGKSATPPPAADHSYDPQNRTAPGRCRLCSPQCGRASRGSPRVRTGSHRISQGFSGFHRIACAGDLWGFTPNTHGGIPQGCAGFHRIPRNWLAGWLNTLVQFSCQTPAGPHSRQTQTMLH